LMNGFQEYKERHATMTESATESSVQGAGSGNGSANP
jgi:hypothetical protein